MGLQHLYLMVNNSWENYTWLKISMYCTKKWRDSHIWLFFLTALLQTFAPFSKFVQRIENGKTPEVALDVVLSGRAATGAKSQQIWKSLTPEGVEVPSACTKISLNFSLRFFVVGTIGLRTVTINWWWGWSEVIFLLAVSQSTVSQWIAFKLSINSEEISYCNWIQLLPGNSSVL